MVDTVVISPATNGTITSIPFYETKFRLHDKRVKSKTFDGSGLSYLEIFIVKQKAVGAQDKLVGARLVING